MTKPTWREDGGVLLGIRGREEDIGPVPHVEVTEPHAELALADFLRAMVAKTSSRRTGQPRA